MAAPLKVLFVSNLFPDLKQPYRGLDNATLLNHLREHCKVRVISPRPTLPSAWRTPQCRAEDIGLAPRYLPARYIPKIGSRWNHRLMARSLRKSILEAKREFAFDVVLCAWLYPDACALALLAEELDFPFVAIAQGSDVHQYLEMPLRREAILKALKCSSRVVTRSAELGRLLVRAGLAPEKPCTIYNGVDLATFRPVERRAVRMELSLPAEAPLVLFVGNFLPVKNPLLLVQAHQQLQQAHPECWLLMIGGGDLETQIRRAAGERVRLLGRKTSREIARYMQAADVLCVPSRNEGVPNVVLEAFASGLRVVATRVGGIPEVLTDASLGRLVPALNGDALTAALAETLSHPGDTNRIRVHGTQFSWERTVSQYREVLSQAALPKKERAGE